MESAESERENATRAHQEAAMIRTRLEDAEVAEKEALAAARADREAAARERADVAAARTALDREVARLEALLPDVERWLDTTMKDGSTIRDRFEKATGKNRQDRRDRVAAAVAQHAPKEADDAQLGG